jgi:hypothetical protein
MSRKIDKNTVIKQPRARRQDRIVIRHDFTGEVAVATKVNRGRAGAIVLWDGREEPIDERGYLAGGWRIVDSDPELARVASKSRERHAKIDGSPVEATSISESDLYDFSSFVRSNDDK